MSTTSASFLFIQPTDTRTATASQIATSGVVEDDPLSNPDTSKIVKVTIACAIMVLVVTGAVAGFKVSIRQRPFPISQLIPFPPFLPFL